MPGVRNGTYRFAIVALATVVAGTASLAVAKQRDLTGRQIKSVITGTLIHMHTPIGTVVPIKYRADGTLRGRAGAVAFFLGAAADRGVWWVKGSKLCQKWSRWFQGRTNCIRVRRYGRKFHWRDDEGESGIATIVSQDKPPARRRPPAPLLAKASPPRYANVSTPTRPPAIARDPAPSVRLTVPPRRTYRRSFSQPIASLTPSFQPTAPRIIEQPAVPARKTQPQKAKRVFRVVGVEAHDKLNIREQPDSDSTVIARIPPFATGIRMLGSCVAEWCRIRYRNRRGWVHTAYVAPEARISATQTGPRKAAAQSFRVVGVRYNDVLNMRLGPTSDAPVVATIPAAGRGIRVIGQCAGEWCPITYRFVSGWVNRHYIARET